MWLICLFVLAMPLFIWPGVTEYGYGKSIFTLIGVSFLLFLWAGWALFRREWRILLPWITLPVIGLVLICLLSLIHATNSRVVIQSLTLLVFFFSFFLVVANVVRERRAITSILFCLLLSSFLASLYGLLQYLGIMPGAHGGRGLGELISVMGNRNYLGGFLAYSLFPAVILLVRLRYWALRTLTILLLSFNFGTVMLVNQTGVVVGLAVATVVFILAFFVFRPIEPIRQNRFWLIILLIFLIFTFLVEAPSGPLNSVVGLSKDQGSWIGELWRRNAGKVRAWDWWIGWEMFKDHPITGVGLGNYKLNFIPYKADFLTTPRGEKYDFYIDRAAQAHNEYVQAAAELGSLGILAVIALLIIVPLSFWVRLRGNRDEGNRLDLILFGCGAVVFVVHALVSFPAHLPASSLVLVLVLGLSASRVYGEAAQWRVRLSGWPLRGTALVIFGLCITVSVIAGRDFSADLLLGKGETQLQVRHYRLAEGTLKKSIHLDFCPRQVYYRLATAMIEQGRFEEARNYLERCLTNYRTEKVYLRLASVSVSLGELETARENIELLLASHPRPDISRQAKYWQGVIDMRDGYLTRAEQELEALVNEQPDFEQGYIVLGHLYRRKALRVNAQENYEIARENYEQALRLIIKKQTQVDRRLSSKQKLPIEEYARLVRQASLLSKEKEAVEEAIKGLSPP
ncbi:MAG: Wzy polymerase domain-containing protein [Candidatus Bipolaricaulota bacterium]|nr:Wzy polymerase domain-containing protein [Candidatus Bipolaricaulota bacterium]